MDSDNEDIGRNFDRASSAVYKLGYQNGASDGKDRNLQDGFDAGFQIGMRLGLVAGFYKQLINEASKDEDSSSNLELKLASSTITDFSVSEAFSDNCVLCDDPKLIDIPYDDVNKIQIERNIDIMKQLINKYELFVKEAHINDSDLQTLMKISDIDSDIPSR